MTQSAFVACIRVRYFVLAIPPRNIAAAVLMSETIGALRDYQLVRWRELAEKRLDYITELFASGRWSLYYREIEFLDVIRQSKALVETWRKLAPPEPDARLPQSPFSLAAEVRQVPAAATAVAGAGDPVHNSDEPTWTEADEICETTNLDRSFEDELAAIALQRLRETPVFDLFERDRHTAA